MTRQDGVGSDERDRLNMEAMLALGLARPSIIEPIVTLLRSGVEIDPIVRNALAEAFEGSRPGGAPQFVVRGTGRGAHPGLSLAHFRRDVSIARFVADRRASGESAKDAIIAAADQFRMSEKHCEAAVTATGKLDRWVASNESALRELVSVHQRSEADQQRMIESMYWGRHIFREQAKARP